MAQSMLKSKGMPKECWAKEVDCMIYLLNHLPTKIVWGKIPQEAYGVEGNPDSHT